MNLGTDGLRIASAAVALLVVVGFGWYVVSGQSARRHGAALARLANELVRTLGTTGRVSLLRGGAVSFTLGDVRPPLRSLQVVARPGSRSIVPFLMDRSGDPRDLIAFAADLTRPPTAAFELIEPSSAVGVRALRRAVAQSWHRSNWVLYDRELTLLAPDVDRAKEILRRAPKFPGGINLCPVRLAVSDTSPHFSLTLADPGLLGGAGPRFGSWLTRLGEAMAKSPSGKVL
jgi:hypothetical protein